MNLHTILTLPARFSLLPVHIALHLWDTVGRRLSHPKPAADLAAIADGNGYWLYWVYPEQRIRAACPTHVRADVSNDIRWSDIVADIEPEHVDPSK